MVYCIPVGDETGHEMGICFWCFLKNEKVPMITQDTVFLACIHACITCYFCPRLREGKFSHLFASRSSPLKAWRSRGRGVFSKPLRCNFPEVTSKESHGMVFMFPLGIHGTDIYIYIHIDVYIYRSMNGGFLCDQCK